MYEYGTRSLSVTEHGRRWRRLLAHFGNWHTIYMRMNRWSKSGVPDRVFERLQREQVVRVKLEAVSMDSAIIKVHLDGTAAQKNGLQWIGRSRGAWTTKLHMAAMDARTAVTFSLSPGQRHDAPEGQQAPVPSRSPRRQSGTGDGPDLRG